MTALAKEIVLAAVRSGRKMNELLSHPEANRGREQTSVLPWDLKKRFQVQEALLALGGKRS